jgi:heme-degrading monooxygenase HmoA
MHAGFARTPRPPYYAVIFTSLRTAGDEAGYGTTADRMVELAAQQPGYLGVESVRGVDGVGITVSYWESEAHIAAWRAHAEHALARERGRSAWYEHYELRVAKVERAYGGPPSSAEPT